MRLLAVSDLHGDLACVRRLLKGLRPGADALLCCGDWGDPGEVTSEGLAAISVLLPVHSTFGNHDDQDLLASWRNLDGTPVLLGQGEVRDVGPLRIGAIGGIWAKSHRKPFYVTDEDVAEAAGRIAAAGPVDILLTHGCPAGYADLTESGRRGGQRCFLEAFHTIAPKIQLCGHLHVAQERTARDGRRVINIGATPRGDAVVIEAQGGRLDAWRIQAGEPRAGGGGGSP